MFKNDNSIYLDQWLEQRWHEKQFFELETRDMEQQKKERQQNTICSIVIRLGHSNKQNSSYSKKKQKKNQNDLLHLANKFDGRHVSRTPFRSQLKFCLVKFEEKFDEIHHPIEHCLQPYCQRFDATNR